MEGTTPLPWTSKQLVSKFIWHYWVYIHLNLLNKKARKALKGRDYSNLGLGDGELDTMDIIAELWPETPP